MDWRVRDILRAKASAAFPENTLASFERAFRDGAEGIESGVCCTRERYP